MAAFCQHAIALRYRRRASALLAGKHLVTGGPLPHISGTASAWALKNCMNFSLPSASVLRLVAAAAVTGLGLSGCYVVPMQPGASLPQMSAQYQSAGLLPAPLATPIAPAAPATQTFAARLYPSNTEAARFGIIGAVVTNDLNGRSYFTTVIDGEQFQGEATRVAG